MRPTQDVFSQAYGLSVYEQSSSLQPILSFLRDKIHAKILSDQGNGVLASRNIVKIDQSLRSYHVISHETHPFQFVNT